MELAHLISAGLPGRQEPECSLLAQQWKLRVLSAGALQPSRRRLGAVSQVSLGLRSVSGLAFTATGASDRVL